MGCSPARGAARRRRRSRLELAAPGVRRARRAVRRGRRRARAAHDRAAARGGREPGRRRVRLPRHRDHGPHRACACCSTPERAWRGRTRWPTRSTPRTRRRSGCCSSTTPGARSSARCCGRSTAGARRRSCACSSSSAPTSTRRRGQPAHALRAGLAHGPPDLCELLAGLGARREVGPIDELIGLCFAGDREGALRLAARAPGAGRAGPRASSPGTRPGRGARAARTPPRSCSSSASGLTGRARWAARRCTTPPGGARRRRRVAARARCGPGAARRARHRRHGARLDRARLVPLPRPGRPRRHRLPPDRRAAGGGRREVEPDMAHEADAELAEWLAERAEPPTRRTGRAGHGRSEPATPSCELGRAGGVAAAARGAQRRAGARSSATGSRSSPASTPTPTTASSAAPGSTTQRSPRSSAGSRPRASPRSGSSAAGSELGPRLVAAGCRAERTAVVMGAAIADLPAARAAARAAWRSCDADRARWIAVAQASSLFEDAAAR